MTNNTCSAEYLKKARDVDRRITKAMFDKPYLKSDWARKYLLSPKCDNFPDEYKAICAELDVHEEELWRLTDSNKYPKFVHTDRIREIRKICSKLESKLWKIKMKNNPEYFEHWFKYSPDYPEMKDSIYES